MGEVIWTEPALADLRGIIEYISVDSPPAAKRLAEDIIGKVAGLGSHPGIGNKIGLTRSPYRRLVLRYVVIFYTHAVKSGEVRIVAVIRPEQDFSPARLRVRRRR